MSIVTMDMCDYQIERNDSTAEAYGDEVLCAGWNHSLALQQHVYVEIKQPDTMPLELVSADVDAFLQEMYAYQC
ncbi:MAG: hypothetical protein PHP70_06655 [Gallionella sp.]|nr:hypothetical protein [Gallionella sp.]